MTRSPARRPAFTLVELLVVIAIIGVLLALTATAVFGVRRGQQNEFSTATLTKLDARIQDKVKKITEQINDDWKNRQITSPEVVAVSAACGGNADVAKAVMLYGRLRQQFPMTLAEAQTPFAVCGFPYPIRPEYKGALAAAAATPGGTPEESAACFYAAVAAEGLEGLNFQQGSVTLGGQSLPVFLDGFGTPIAFVRLGYDGDKSELNGGTAQFDPFYTLKNHNLKADFGGTFDAQVWAAVRPNGMPANPGAWVPAPSAAGGAWTGYPAGLVNLNHKTFLISAGPNKQYADRRSPASQPVRRGQPAQLPPP